MRFRYVVALMVLLGVFFSCSKDKTATVPPIVQGPVPPLVAPDSIFLKDVLVPHLPSPYYHFEYDPTGKIIKYSFASDLTIYNVVYIGGGISEIDNNTLVNKDRLLYSYNDQGQLNNIKYIDKTGLLFRRCFLSYDSGRVKKMEWELNVSGAFVTERTLSFVYQPDGNLLEMTDHRHKVQSQTEATYTDRFEQYDNKINVDGFSIIKVDFFDHLLLLPGIQFQKNNAGKVIHSGDGVNYTVDYTYTYNDKNFPLNQSGDFVYTNGTQNGQHVAIGSVYSYY
jgi:hypothetical protein